MRSRLCTAGFFLNIERKSAFMKQKINFVKYQGTGNDFIMIDNRGKNVSSEAAGLAPILCNRKFGIGADGVILIENHNDYDFEMIYFNSDGTQSLCGNGSRCAMKFAHDLGMIEYEASFLTIEGRLKGSIRDDLVHLKMPDVHGITRRGEDFLVNTGSPHLIRFVNDLQNLNVYDKGKQIRYGRAFLPEGTNVNFVQRLDDRKIFVRTYERGVENETLSCGTGVTAAALVFGEKHNENSVNIHTMGGELNVNFESGSPGMFRNVYLIGPAEKVFEGNIIIQ